MSQIPWSRLPHLLSPLDVRAANALRARHTELKTILAQAVPTIQFENYKLANAKIVEQARKAVEGYTPKSIDVKGVVGEIEGERGGAVQHAKQTAMNVEKTVKQYRDDLDSLKKMAPYEDLLIDDVYAANPGLEEEFIKRLKLGRPFVEDAEEGAVEESH